MLSGAIVKCDDACRLRGVVVKIDTSVAADKVSLQMTCFFLCTQSHCWSLQAGLTLVVQLHKH